MRISYADIKISSKRKVYRGELWKSVWSRVSWLSTWSKSKLPSRYAISVREDSSRNSETSYTICKSSCTLSKNGWKKRKPHSRKWVFSDKRACSSWEKCRHRVELHSTVEYDISDILIPRSTRESTKCGETIEYLTATVEIYTIWSSIKERPPSTRKIERSGKCRARGRESRIFICDTTRTELICDIEEYPIARSCHHDRWTRSEGHTARRGFRKKREL